VIVCHSKEICDYECPMVRGTTSDDVLLDELVNILLENIWDRIGLRILDQGLEENDHHR